MSSVNPITPVAVGLVSDYRSVLKLHFDVFTSCLATYLTRSPTNPQRFAHRRITRATMTQLYELSTDIYDELNRRKTLTTSSLPARHDFPQQRNERRQEISILTPSQFEELSGDVYLEIARLFPEFYNHSAGDTLSCSSDENSLALSCWILRQQYPRHSQGLKRARFPKKAQVTSTETDTGNTNSETKIILPDDIKVLHTDKDIVAFERNSSYTDRSQDAPPAYTEINTDPTLFTPRSCITSLCHDFCDEKGAQKVNEAKVTQLEGRFASLRRLLKRKSTRERSQMHCQPGTIASKRSKRFVKLGVALKKLTCISAHQWDYPS